MLTDILLLSFEGEIKSLTGFFLRSVIRKLGIPGGSDGKESAYNVGDLGLIPGSGSYPWRRKRQPILVCSPGKPHGWRDLAGYSP